MVHEGHADGGVGVDHKWTSSGSTTDPGALSVDDDGVGEEEEVVSK